MSTALKGFAHINMSNKTFKRSTHWDPGVNFPWSTFLGLVEVELGYIEGRLPIKVVPAKPSAPVAPSHPPYAGPYKVGSKGAGVKAMQVQLKKRGWKIDVDGIFGKGTESVIKAYEKDKGLKPRVSGQVAKGTWVSIFSSKVT